MDFLLTGTHARESFANGGTSHVAHLLATTPCYSRDSTENRGSVETGDAGGEAWAAAAAKGGTSTVRQQQFMEQNTPHNHNSENSTERRERERRASLLVFLFVFTDWGTRTGAVGEWWVLQTKQKATLARRLIINSENSNHKFFREKRQVSLWIFTDWDARAGARVVGKLILQNVLGTAAGRVKHQCWGVLQLVRSSKSPPGRGAFYEPCTMTSHHSVLPSVRSATLSREAFLFNMRLILNSENFQCHK